MRLHLLGIPHTVTHHDWSHCAFTQTQPTCYLANKRPSLFCRTLSSGRVLFPAIERGRKNSKLLRLTPSVVSSPYSSALPTSSSAFAQNSILQIKGVSVLAVRLTRKFSSSCVTTKQVFACRDRLKVIWIEARSVAAKVINLQPFRDWAANQFIHCSMGANCFSVDSHGSVPFKLSRQHPTLVRVADVLQQTHNRGIFSHSKNLMRLRGGSNALAFT